VNPRTTSGLCAGIGLALLLVAPQLARAGTPDNADAKWRPVGKGNYEKVPGWGTTTAPRVGKPWVGQGPKVAPPEETPSAPVPEPGTMTLAAMGLMAVGAAIRKRRGARTPAGTTTT
jgi:PEP-CTERM motif